MDKHYYLAELARNIVLAAIEDWRNRQTPNQEYPPEYLEIFPDAETELTWFFYSDWFVDLCDMANLQADEIRSSVWNL